MAPSYLGIVRLLFLLEENVKLWLVYLDTREAERSGECGGRRGQVWGYGDGLRKRTVGGQEEERERQKRERLGLRDKGKSTNMQMCKEGISTSLGVLSKREA